MATGSSLGDYLPESRIGILPPKPHVDTIGRIGPGQWQAGMRATPSIAVMLITRGGERHNLKFVRNDVLTYEGYQRISQRVAYRYWRSENGEALMESVTSLMAMGEEWELVAIRPPRA